MNEFPSNMTALPPLPMQDLSRDNLYGYTAEQMRSYALAAIEQERERVKNLCNQFAATGRKGLFLDDVARLLEFAAIRTPMGDKHE